MFIFILNKHYYIFKVYIDVAKLKVMISFFFYEITNYFIEFYEV